MEKFILYYSELFKIDYFLTRNLIFLLFVVFALFLLYIFLLIFDWRFMKRLKKAQEKRSKENVKEAVMRVSSGDSC
ncbi:hypothetical protein C0584_04010 [Candidatus Parcubacteria bacterium]|nr:MAG: hypothetical protein C0584_04010 [Candidatus Parcubacteria bacterium]